MSGIQMMMLGRGSSAVNIPTLSYITSTIDITNATQYTFTNLDIGGPGLIIATLHAAQGGTTNLQITSCTIGGVSATMHVNPSTSPDTIAIASAEITSGSTATVVFDVTPQAARGVVGIYRLTNYNSATPVGTASTTTGTNPVRSVSVSTSADGIVVANTSHSDQVTFTWTNATADYYINNVTEPSSSFGGASATGTSSGTRTIDVTASASPNQGFTLGAVSWR